MTIACLRHDIATIRLYDGMTGTDAVYARFSPFPEIKIPEFPNTATVDRGRSPICDPSRFATSPSTGKLVGDKGPNHLPESWAYPLCQIYWCFDGY